MKELEQMHEVPMGTRTLKSLLKKPGHSKQRTQKNRVTINEKLNEFFAADYIILIKEECCGDYEEECDCCCQEPEMIRLGNCKECRAEFTRQLAAGDIDTRFATERNGNKIIDNGCDLSRRVGAGVGGCISVGGLGIPGSEESQEDEDEDDEDEEEEYEEEVDDDDNDEAESSEEADQRNNPLAGDPMTPVQLQAQTHETLSPPEGYKDVCDEDMQTDPANDMCPSTGAVVVCGECNYYRQRTPDGDKDVEEDGNSNTQIDESAQKTLEQSQQTTPDIQQRYLVETITMTTVTERRIVREISEDKGLTPAPTSNTSPSSSPASQEDQTDKPPITNPPSVPNGSAEAISNSEAAEDDKPTENSPAKEEHPPDSELMPFKLSSSSLVTNSLKPNSAVRQLFPNPKFISPPPALSKGMSLSNDETDSDSEAQRYLVTTESLRLFDSVKRAKMAGSRSDSSESDSSTIKRTIERNALRRSLVCKYDTLTRKKNLMSKDVSLEERIRQLTCVDPEEDTTYDSASDSLSAEQNHLAIQGQDLQDLPARTSPNGEERPLGKARDCPEHSPSPPLHHHHHHHHYHHHHHNPSTYKKITDLFGQKKIDNMPDLGLGDRSSPKTSTSKLNSDRKQFLASLAPLSCVANTGIDGNDYYQLSSKISRDSVGYASDSSYSLEDIEAALRGDERNGKTPGPPDVTRGTPTGVGPDASDATTDELLAFVEQDKSRTERLKRRYDTEDKEEKNVVDEDDDELNDYGFNRRPAVRGIKPQFESSEIVRQLRYRTIPASVDKRQASWPYYDTDNHHLEKRVTFTSTAAAAAVGVGIGVGVNVEPDEISLASSRDSTINRINTMQRQIDDIYQTIAESALSIQGTLDRGSYLESTLPRGVSSRIPVVPPPPLPPGDCHRYQDAKTGGAGHFQETPRMRMSNDMPMYSTLSKPRRAVAISNYPCGVVPIESSTKCYRTMYLVPYNGLSDPTYQNIQRILPPHSSASYADHIERYPYPRNVEGDGNQVPRYYPRAGTAGSSSGPGGASGHVTPAIVPPPPLHLRLQPEDMGFNPGPGVGMQTILQHQHISQLATYNVQSVPAYTVMAPSRPGYPYPVHPRGNVEGTIQGQLQSQSQSQTGSLPPTMTTNTVASGFNGNHHLACTSSSSSTSSALSSPTKTPAGSNLCSTAERGVPEGAASAPAHDFVSQANNVTYGHNVPPPNTQNSVYYAMNV
ncbi:uncharacterized protein LOC123268191 isoform X1 [Cotesia glomerata]|uniref:uncharacterized protein LOC123268191 isoform X1 n=1 Tax=Cotesia glomerata TaxID=32391 RepID=UPI001D014B79|nr:uncharacterized protein LOC123268191 isoform X1 [Cotesia glomerata]XP_044589039.1 uncharacterized protein LOC123268191 isoform X1 [Cotesia glomerata]